MNLILRPTTGSELDTQITCINNSALSVANMFYPDSLTFKRSEIQGVYVPHMEGIKLRQNFFDDIGGWDYIAGYPGHLFADFAFADLSSGTFSVFGVRDFTQPFMPGAIMLYRNAAFNGGVASYRHIYESLVIPTAGQWTSPIMVISIGDTLNGAMASYWNRNGHDAMPLLASKLNPNLLTAISNAVLVMVNFQYGGKPFSYWQSYISNLPVNNLLHFVAFWPRGFDENYPDYLPPEANLGTLSDFQQLVSSSRSSGHMVMPYTNPTWWDEESPTLISLGLDIAVYNRDGTYLYQTYGGGKGTPPHGGYVVSTTDPRVILRQDQTRNEFTLTVPCDFLFEDQVGGRSATYDGNRTAPNPLQYNQGLVDLAERSASFLPVMSENGFDRISWYETGFCGSQRVGWDPWTSNKFDAYPMAQLWAHENIIFYPHNLAGHQMTINLDLLTYHIALGYSLSQDVVFTPDLNWLKVIDTF